jgi:uncharacterized lipoprotein YmbA
MRAIAFTLSLGLVLGCSSTPAAHSSYLLRADELPGTRPIGSPAPVGLRRVVVAPYLESPGLVLETAPGEVRAARYHEWAEPLDQGVRLYLRAELSTLLGEDVDANPTLSPQWSYAVDVAIDQLHGTVSGEALLVAGWRIADAQKAEEIGRFRFVQRLPLERDGYPGLADAEIALLARLAAAIADSVREVQQAGP